MKFTDFISNSAITPAVTEVSVRSVHHSSLRPVVFSSDRVQERAEPPWPCAGGDGKEQEDFCCCYQCGSGRKSSGPREVVSSWLLGCLKITFRSALLKHLSEHEGCFTE